MQARFLRIDFLALISKALVFFSRGLYALDCDGCGMDRGCVLGAAVAIFANNGDTLAVVGFGGGVEFVGEQGLAHEILVLCSGYRLLGGFVGVVAC